MNISGPAAVAKPEMLFYAPGDLTVTVQSLRYKLVNESVKLVNKKDLVSKTLHFVATFTRPMLVI